jgi:HD-GYP domain-containing protein (c-di-GMP phosphodiesterase class II)
MAEDAKDDPPRRVSEEKVKALWGAITPLSVGSVAKGPFTRDHSQAVSWLSAQIAMQMGLSEREIQDIKAAGIVHDIGTLGVPEGVLRKPTLLTPEEFDLVKSHAARGAKMLEPLKEPAIERMVRHHHEFFDGHGYPDGLKGEQIPLGARIIAVAEAFDAIVSDRPFKSARTFDEAVAEIRRCSGTQFDPKAVDALIQLIESDSGLPKAEFLGTERTFGR